MIGNRQVYQIGHKQLALRLVESARLVVPARDNTAATVAARLARSSRLAVLPRMPAGHLVVRGDLRKFAEFKNYRDIKYSRGVFLTEDGFEVILTDEVLVRFKKSIKEFTRQKLIHDMKCRFRRRVDEHLWLVRLDDPGLDKLDELAAPLLMADRLARLKEVVYAEPNAILQSRPAYDPTQAAYFAEQWHLATVMAQQAWGLSQGDPAIRVLIHDCGVDPKHPDLKPNLLKGRDFDNDDDATSPSDKVGSEDSAHGTVCAGVVAATGKKGVAGIAPSCKIVPLKATILTVATWAETFSWAAQNSDVISCSWSLPKGYPCDTLKQQIAAAAQVVPIFCAAGNDSVEGVCFPADQPDTIAVGASTIRDEKWADSNWGDGLDLVAPGDSIKTTDESGKNAGYNQASGTDRNHPSLKRGNYCVQAGTSLAAPLAAGVAALMLSYARTRGRTLSPATVRQILRETADKVGPANDAFYKYQPSQNSPQGKSKFLGSGRINAFQAVNEVRRQLDASIT